MCFFQGSWDDSCVYKSVSREGEQPCFKLLNMSFKRCPSGVLLGWARGTCGSALSALFWGV